MTFSAASLIIRSLQHMSRWRSFVAGPDRDDCNVDARLQQMHGSRMSKRVGGLPTLRQAFFEIRGSAPGTPGFIAFGQTGSRAGRS